MQPCLFNIKEVSSHGRPPNSTSLMHGVLQPWLPCYPPQDPTEHNDLAASNPSKVAEMMQAFNALDKEYHGSDSPSLGQDHDGYCAAAAKNSGFMVPWR